jgi:competence protein ComEC
MLALAACGAARCALYDLEYRQNSLRNQQAEEYVEITGRLARSPGRELERDVLTLEVESLSARGRTSAVKGIMRLNVPFVRGGRGRLRLSAGDRLRASVKLAGPAGFRNFGVFSYERHLETLGVHRRASTKSVLLIERLPEGARRSPRTLFSRLRGRFERALETFFPGRDGDISPTGAVLEALLLGEDGRMSPETVFMLQRSGLYHLFAISGSHIAVVAFLLFSALKALGMSGRGCSLTLALFLVFYTMLVESSPNVLRATIMAETLLVGRLVSRDVSILNTLALSAFILLAANPMSLFEAGFDLTYAATLSIVIFAPRIARRLPKLPFGLAELTAMSAAASLGVLPIIARNFNRVISASLVLNLAAVPLTGVIMGVGYVFLPLAVALPGPARYVAVLLGFMTAVFTRVATLLDPFPVFSFRVPTPGAWVVCGYAAALLLAALEPKRRPLRVAAAALAGLFILLMIAPPHPPAARGLKVTMIDVGQGDSFLVEFPGRKKMLIDGGGLTGTSFDVGERVVSPFLWSKGIRRLDFMVASHAHPDHIGGLAAVAGNFKVGELWEAASQPAAKVLTALEGALRPGTARLRLSAGYVREVDGVTVEVLHPAGGTGAEGADPNEASLVLKLTYGEKSFLFTGDIGPEAESELLRSGADLRSDVLKAPHHGSARSSSKAFVEAVRPEVVLIPVGWGNPFGFPGRAALENYRGVNALVLRADLDGAAEVATDGRALRARSYAGVLREPAPKPYFGLYDGMCGQKGKTGDMENGGGNGGQVPTMYQPALVDTCPPFSPKSTTLFVIGPYFR